MATDSTRDETRSTSRFTRFLSGSMATVLRRLGIRSSNEDAVRVLLKEAIDAGILGEAEHEILKRVFRLGDHRASELMTPMTEVVWLDVTDPPNEMQRKITRSPHSRFPVCEGSIDNMLGIVQVKDLLVHSFSGQPLSIKGLLKLPLFIYEGNPALKVLEMFRASEMHVAIVLDEYGSVRGLLTLNDILEAIVGDLPQGEDLDEPRAVQRPDGSWQLDGMLSLEEVQDLLGITRLPEGDYQTLAGFVISQVGRIPAAADRFEWGGHCFEVVDMDGHRVDKILVARCRKA
jgi:putative hemolysin